MIQANELRVGNYIQYHHGIFKVEPLTIFNVNNEPHFYGSIPLTEEILLKCGFVKVRYEKYAHNKLDKLRAYPHVNKEGFGIYIMGSYTLPNIKYLHQLQNLYYFLCGQELNVNV